MAGEAATTQTAVAADSGSTSSTTPPAGETTAAVAVSRPDWLPESYWDAEKNAPNVDAIKAADAARTERESRLKDIPQDGAYKFELPEDFKLPEGVKYEAPAGNDPEVKAFFSVGKDIGLTQSQMSKLLGFEATRRLAAFQNAQKLETARAEQMKSLGDNAGPRVEQAQRGVNALLGEKKISADRHATLASLLHTADGVQLVEDVLKGGDVRMRGLPGALAPNRNAEVADMVGKSPAMKIFEAAAH